MKTLLELVEELERQDLLLAAEGKPRIVSEAAMLDEDNNLTPIWKEFVPKYDHLLRSFHFKGIPPTEDWEVLKAVIGVNEKGIPNTYQGFIPLSVPEFLIVVMRLVHATTHLQLNYDDSLLLVRETAKKWFDSPTVDKALDDLVSLTTNA